MSIHIKICGFTEPTAIEAAVAAGVDAIGLVLDPSPRQLSLEAAVDLAQTIPPHIQCVAVCGRPTLDEIQRIAARLAPDWIQLMADAIPAIPAIPHGFSFLPAFEDGTDLEVRVDAYRAQCGESRPLILADGPRSGSGILADWDRVIRLADRARLMLAGGLNSENVADAIARMRPYGVDVSSGVERGLGIKDPDKIRAFVAAVRQAERDLGGAS
jgi:phosphoribosylanthranilate isomerase